MRLELLGVQKVTGGDFTSAKGKEQKVENRPSAKGGKMSVNEFITDTAKRTGNSKATIRRALAVARELTTTELAPSKHSSNYYKYKQIAASENARPLLDV